MAVALATGSFAMPLLAQQSDSVVPPAAVPVSTGDSVVTTIPGSAIPEAVLPQTPMKRRVENRTEELGPPLSPRRAFLTSLLLPGYAQAKLDRPMASMLFATMEVLAIGMARKSAQDLREARNTPKDSVFLGYTVNPATGERVSLGWKQSRYTPDLLKARRTHYEDWITAIIFNHVISSADAFVAAHLWDFKPNVEFDPMNNQARIGARKTF